MTEGKEKPKFVVRKDGDFYLAEFNMDFFGDEIQSGVFYTGPDFRRYLTTGDQVEEPLELVASAGLGMRYYTRTERLSEMKNKIFDRRRNIANVQLGILKQAEEAAEQEEAPYFGLVVVSQQGSFSTKPINADKEPFDSSDKYGLSQIGDYNLDESLPKNSRKLDDVFDKKPKITTWVLHPTVQLYVRGDGK